MLQGGVGSTRCLRLPTRSSRFPGTCDGPVGLCHWQFRTKSSSLQGKNTRNQSNGNGVSSATAFPRLAFLHSTKAFRAMASALSPPPVGCLRTPSRQETRTIRRRRSFLSSLLHREITPRNGARAPAPSHTSTATTASVSRAQWVLR